MYGFCCYIQFWVILMPSLYTRQKTVNLYTTAGNSPSSQPVFRFLKEFQIQPRKLNFNNSHLTDINLHIVFFFAFSCSLHNILQVYKCHVGYDSIKIVAVKIVKVEPQYPETQEVRLVIVMYIKGVCFLSARTFAQKFSSRQIVKFLSFFQKCKNKWGFSNLLSEESVENYPDFEKNV